MKIQLNQTKGAYMLKQVFEKKYGKIQSEYDTGNVGGVVNAFTEKSGIDHKSQPEYVWGLVQNFAKLDDNLLNVDALNGVLKNLEFEKRRAVRGYYMDALAHRFFYTDLWQSNDNLVTRACAAWTMSDSEKGLSVKILKTFKFWCKKFRHTPYCIDFLDIDDLIRKYAKPNVSKKSIPNTKLLRDKKIALCKIMAQPKGR